MQILIIQFLLKCRYITKDAEGIDNYYAIMHAAKKSVIENPITTIIQGFTDPQLQVRALLIRVHSLLNSATQICSNIVSTMLLDLPMSYKYDK